MRTWNLTFPHIVFSSAAETRVFFSYYPTTGNCSHQVGVTSQQHNIHHHGGSVCTTPRLKALNAIFALLPTCSDEQTRGRPRVHTDFALRIITKQTFHRLHTYPSVTSRGSSVSIVFDCTLDGRSAIPGRGKRFFLYPLCPDQLWGPPSLLSGGYRGSFPRGYSAAGAWRWPSLPSRAEVKNE
jgi:hypothetical protein